MTMKLILKDEEAVYQPARRLSPLEREVVNTQIDEWINKKIVALSVLDYASPVVLVKKKKNGSCRLCLDYRLVNKK